MSFPGITEALRGPDRWGTTLVCHRQVQTADKRNRIAKTAQDIPFSGVVTIAPSAACGTGCVQVHDEMMEINGGATVE